MTVNRRRFIQKSALGLTALGVTTALPSMAGSTRMAASDKVNIALIGCKNMGFGILKHSLGFDDVNLVALCDVDDTVLNERAQEVSKDFGAKPTLLKDFRKVLEMKEVDAVIIGTPDHWHCLNTVYAMQAGKDVYVEKPMANTIGECNIMLKAAQRYGRVLQVGQQQRSSPLFLKAMELIKSGTIGSLRKVNIWANFNYGLGPLPAEDSAVPAGVDYEMWLGPAPQRPFNVNRFHASWRHFWDYGGGLMSDWGVHLIDMALWAKEITTGPQEVLTLASNTSSEKRMRETFDTMSVIYKHGDFVINYDLNAGVQRGPYDKLYGLAFIGDKATIVANREYLEVFPEWDDVEKKPKAEAFKLEQKNQAHKLHARNFLDCVKSRNAPVCTPAIGRAAAIHAHIPNIAARTGERVLKWNDEKNEFTNSAAANKLITPTYRKPWQLPKV